MVDDELKKVKEQNERQKKYIEQILTERKNNEVKTNIYYGIRFIQIICIGLAVFGGLWKGTEVLNLDTPGFLMVYGGSGALISEVVARIFKKKITK